MAYNDPTLGEQVISSSEFSRLWGLQGCSGVVVAPEPPPNTPDLTPWVALAAGLMALVSTTPLGALRNGVGGMLTAGTVGVSRKPSAPAPKPAPKPAPWSDPPEKEKDKEPKKPAAPMPASTWPSEARFITKVKPAPAAAWPSEARYVTKAVPEPVPTFPSEARFITKGAPQPAPTSPSEARFITKVAPQPAPAWPSEARFVQGASRPRVLPTVVPRFDDELPPPPTPAPICTPVPRYFLVPGPTPTPSPTLVPNLTLEQFAQGACAVSDAVDPFQTNPAFAGGPGGLKGIILHLTRRESDHPVPSLLKPLGSGRVVIHLIRRAVAVAVDLDDQASFRARAGRHERQYVSPRRKSAMNRPTGCCRRILKPS